ncbi:uncharacterized protein A4U43_C01F18570 [Asparagus officinalis]|uniref:Uncharacterized protein n=1 Tax=Asparagus officinalis TaxID=4686 RepID=A0A5P1FSV3_ASPOF|nr:uncharacterized protein A4U43_C01F18570 [Asparagus officinalis]
MTTLIDGQVEVRLAKGCFAGKLTASRGKGCGGSDVGAGRADCGGGVGGAQGRSGGQLVMVGVGLTRRGGGRGFGR